MKASVWRYLRYEKKKVEGWLQRVDAEIIGSILDFQARESLKGGCVEIGVHHGKSFIPLCMSLKDEEAILCIDLFEDQQHNRDSSGRGDFDVFMSNLRSYQIDSATVRIIKGSSDCIRPEQIIDAVGPVRFFSIDGGHWEAIVRNDLALAEATLASCGVIALDDYFRADWPDVTYAYVQWQSNTNSDIVPFAIGSNKLYLCRREWASRYRSVIKTPSLAPYFSKSYRTDMAVVDSYRVEPFKQDEERWAAVLCYLIKVFRPNFFTLLRKIRVF